MLFIQKHAYITLAEVLTVLVMFTLVSTIFAQNVPWIQKTDMPSGRHSHAASVVDGKIYVAGGRYTLNLLNEYDPATDTWTTKASMPTGRMALSGCAVNGKFYALGGIAVAFQSALSTVEEYDPVTDNWATKTSMPTKRLGLGTSAVDGKIYAIGGMTSGSNFWSGMLDTVEIYDPETDSWSTGSSMPTKRCWFSTSVVDGKIYVIGGILVTKEVLSTVQVYDPATDTWTPKTSMPTARAGHAAAVVNGIIYVIGGGTHNGQPVGGYSVVEAYNPENDTWTQKAEMPVPRAFIFAPELDGKIYIIGGIPDFADPHDQGEKTVYVYDPSKDLTEVVNTCSINKYFAKAGNDSICIKTKLNDPTGVILLAKIQAPDQTPVDSIQLFDDGNHNDGTADDSLFANIWSVNSTVEQQYNLDLTVMRIDSDTVIYNMDNIVKFTTIGPIVFEGLTFRSSDPEPNPGDEFSFQISLKNEGLTATAADVKVGLSTLDTLVNFINTTRSFYDIEAGNTKTNSSYYMINISKNCPDSTEIKFALDITSNNYHFWSDSFSILVVEPSTRINLNENAPKQFILNQNYPNPFNPKTVIGYSLPVTCEVNLSIYNILGQKVYTLVNKKQSNGNYEVNFDALDLSSGIYIYNLHGDGVDISRKMIVMK
jgi:N-acetylneuraminic acid mutarotase